MIVDFHSHTNASDGALEPAGLLALMRRRGVAIFSITDHDTMRAYDGVAVDFARVVPGVEINTTWNGNDVHVLGYKLPLGADTPLAKQLEANRTFRRTRIDRMLTNLAAEGYPLEVDDVLAESDGGHAIGRPHVAKALIRKGYTPDVESAFRDLLSSGKPGYLPSTNMTPGDAVELIAAAGGVPVLAHPGRLKNEDVLPELVERGLVGLEVFYSTHTPSQTAHFREQASRYGLVMTAGSDFHDARWNVRGVGMDVDAGDIGAFLERLG